MNCGRLNLPPEPKVPRKSSSLSFLLSSTSLESSSTSQGSTSSSSPARPLPTACSSTASAALTTLPRLPLSARHVFHSSGSQEEDSHRSPPPRRRCRRTLRSSRLPYVLAPAPRRALSPLRVRPLTTFRSCARADPLDTIKVRMQLSRSSRGKGVSPRSFVSVPASDAEGVSRERSSFCVPELI